MIKSHLFVIILIMYCCVTNHQNLVAGSHNHLFMLPDSMWQEFRQGTSKCGLWRFQKFWRLSYKESDDWKWLEWLRTGITWSRCSQPSGHGWVPRNRATQQEVSGRQASEASSLFIAAPHYSPIKPRWGLLVAGKQAQAPTDSALGWVT